MIRKATSKIFALVLSFAIVFSGVIWLGPANVDAATDMSNYTFAAAVVDSEGNAVNGVVVKAYLEDMETPVTTGGYDSSFNWVESPVALTSANGEVTLSLSRLSAGFDGKDLVFVVEDENYESEDSHSIQVNSSTTLTKVDGADFNWETPPAISYVVKEKSAEPVSTEWSAEDFTFEGATVTGLSDSGKAKVAVNPDMVIPDKNGDTEITAIGANAFATTAITSVVFPAGLTSIGQTAFRACNSIKSVEIPDSVTELGPGLFTTSTSLESIKFPQGIEEIPSGVCNGCNNLKSIDIPDSVRIIGGNAFSKAFALEEIKLPASLEEVGRNAFLSSHLKEVILPDTTKKLESGAFSCYGNHKGSTTPDFTLANIVLNEGLEEIANDVFKSCKVEQVELPSTVKVMSATAFGQAANHGAGRTLVIPAEGTEYPDTVARNVPGDKNGYVFQFKVELDACGGSVEPGEGKTNAEGKLIDALPEAEKRGEVFLGWFTAAEDGDEITSDTVFVEDTTVYAHWNKVEDLEEAVAKVNDAEKANEEAQAACDALGNNPTDAEIKTASEKAAAAVKAAEDAVKAAEEAKAKQTEGSAEAAVAENLVNDAKAANTSANKLLETAKAAADKAAADKAAADKAKADAAAAKVQSVTTVTVNAKTVNAAAVDAAVAAAGGSKDYVTTIVLGKKVKKIKANTFKNYNKVTTLEVQTKKLTKKSVKKSLKGSAVKTVKVKVAKKAATNKKYVKKYKKIFTKKNAGKKATVKK